MAQRTITVAPTTMVDTIGEVETMADSQVVNNNPTNIARVTSDGSVDIASLSEEDKRKYSKISSAINPKDINSIVNYGSELQHTMNRHSNSFLTAVRTNKAGAEISGLVDNLLGELSCIDVDELTPPTGIKRVLRKIPILRHLVTSVDKIMQKYDTVEKNIDTIAKKIAATRLVSLRDNNALQKMFQDNIEYIKQIEDLIIAAKIKQQEIHNQLAEMEQNPAAYETYEISDMQEFAGSLERRIYDMTTLHYVMKQSLPQIRLVQNNNLQTANKAQSIIATTIPVWRNQLSLAVALSNQSASIKAQRKVTDATNEIMKRNAEMLHQNSIDIAKENERGILDVETLRQTTQKLIDTLHEVKNIHEQGTQARREAEAEILRIEQELESSTLQIGNSRSDYYLNA